MAGGGIGMKISIAGCTREITGRTQLPITEEELMIEEAATDVLGYNAETILDRGTARPLRQLPALFHQALRLVWNAAPRQLALSVGLQVVGGMALGAQLLVARHLLSRLLEGRSSQAFSAALPSVIVLVITLAVSGIVVVLRTEMQRLLSELVSWMAMQHVVRAATEADLVSFDDPSFHDRLQRSIVNASVRPLQMTTGLLTVGSALLSSAAVGFTLALIEPLFLVLALVAVVPVAVVTLRVGRALFEFAVRQTPTDRERVYVQSLLTEKEPAKEIRAYGLSRHLKARYDDLYARRIAALRRLVRSRMIQGVTGSVLTAGISGGVLILLILFVADGRTSLAGAGAAGAALILLGGQLQGLAAGVGQLYESALFVQDFRDFTTTIPSSRQLAGTDAPPEEPGRIEVHKLRFTYPSRVEPSLVDIDLTIEPGQVVALVGENGSGKTTLAKLLAGLYPAESGLMTWDGMDVATFDAEQLRSRVAVLFQDFVHYFFSAQENIALGRWERASDHDAIRRAAEEVQIDAVLESLPHGFETFLGPQFFGGSDLSGGQWQRVALARALFRDARVVILDEPSASLDPRAESALFDSVRKLFVGRSVVLISHRFSSVRMADVIYVLRGGRVVERGSHDELMGMSGLYAELFRLQAAPFEGHADSWQP
jgi:ATP-binding cassette, subfamily B, bacterial